MYCPNCAKDNSVGLRYCTGCGFRLDTVQVVVDAQTANVGSQPEVTPKRSWLQVQNPTIVGLFLTILGIVVSIIGAANHDRDIKDLGTFMNIVGVIIVALPALVSTFRNLKAPKQVQPPLLRPEPPRQLNVPNQGYEVGSVTEQATKELNSTR